MSNIIKLLLGVSGKNDEVIERKSQEAHDIKNDITKDILRTKKKVDKINLDTTKKLKEVSNDLNSITYKIAVATGGKKRGLL